MGGGFHGPNMGGGWHRPPRHYGGGCGCCGGFFGLPLLILFFVIWMMIPSGGVEYTFSSDGYNEEKFQDYADSQYAAEFGSSSAYEDNLLITVLVEDEDYYNFYYIAWVGDHISSEISSLLGNNDTVLGQTMESSINASSYKYSLDSDLARTVDTMGKLIGALDLESSFTCTEDHAQVKSHLTNRSSVDMTEDTVNSALQAFTETTGIPIVIVVEDMDEVFGRSGSSGVNVGAIVAIAALVIGVAVIVFTIRRQRGKKDEFGTAQKDSRYHDFDDQY